MTADQFQTWLEVMKDTGQVRSDADCARLLGISAGAVVAMKKRGADKRTALACAAIYHRIPHWREGGTFDG